MNPAMWLAIFGTMAGYLAWKQSHASLDQTAYVTSDAAPPDAFSDNAPSIGQQIISDVENFIGLNADPSPSIRAYIQATESFSPTPYLDPPGNTIGQYSIGYGHKVVPGDQYWPYGPLTSITEDRAQTQFDLDVDRAGAAVSRLVTVPLTQGQFDALVDFTYNEGQGHLGSSTLLKKLNAGDYYGAAAEFQKWVYAGGRVLQNLVARRQYDAQTFVG